MLKNIVYDGDDIFIIDDSGNIEEKMEKSSFSAEEIESFELIPVKKCYYDKKGKFHLVRAPLCHCHTDGSTLDGAVKAKTLAQLGGEVIAITDHGSMTETFNFYKEMKALGKIPIIGCEVYTENMIDGEKKANHMILLVKNLTGYHNICEIMSQAEDNFYRKPQVSYKMLQNFHEGIICTSACLGGEIPKAIMDGNNARAEEVIDILYDIFGEDFYLEVQRHGIDGEELVNETLFQFAKEKGIKVIATPDSHYAREDDAIAHEVLVCIGTHKTYYDPSRMKFEGENYHIPTQTEFEQLWADKPQVFDGLFDLAEKIDFDFETGKLFTPNFPCPDGKTQDEYFVELVKKGFAEKFPSFASAEEEKTYNDRLEYEIKTILQMGFSGYFLIVQDYADYARSIGGYVGPGRGSAVGSLCAYCLGITNLDPIPYGLLFERERLRSLNPVNKVETKAV